MEYAEFVKTVEYQLNKVMKGDVKATSYTAKKNNDTEKRGVMIEAPGINISPTIYLEEFYENYKRGVKLEDIVAEIEEFYESIKREESWNCETILKFEGVKDKVVFKLINTKQNKELLKDIPHIEFLDLSLVFYVLLEVSGDGTAAMMVTNEHMKRWEVDEKELWKRAGENSKRLLPAEFFTMRYALRGFVNSCSERKRKAENLLANGGCGRDGMYVLSNRMGNYGAACIAYPYLLEMIADILKCDYYVLPSSVHEVVIVPDSYEVRGGELDEMVREINRTQVPAEEVLSDHSYIYERRSGRLSMRAAGRR